MYSEQYDDERLAQASEDIVFEMRDDLIKAEQRIAELTAAMADTQAYNATLVNDMAKAQKRIGELEQTILYLTAQCQECVEQLSEGKEYSEGCKP